MIDRIFHRLSFAVLGCAFLLLMYFNYLQFYPFEIVELQEDPMPIVVPESLSMEENMRCLQVNFVKHYDFKPEIRWYVVNTAVVPLRDEGIRRPQGFNNNIVCFHIPDILPTGEYKIQVDLSYKITSFRTIEYTWESEKFDINRKDGE